MNTAWVCGTSYSYAIPKKGYYTLSHPPKAVLTTILSKIIRPPIIQLIAIAGLIQFLPGYKCYGIFYVLYPSLELLKTLATTAVVL